MSPGECSAAVAGVRVPETLRKRISSGANEHRRTRNPSSSGGLTNSGFFSPYGRSRNIHRNLLYYIYIVYGIILSHSSNVVHQNQWKTELYDRPTHALTHVHTCRINNYTRLFPWQTLFSRALAEDGGGTYPNGTRSVDLEQTSLQCTHRRVTIVCALKT